MIFSPIALKVFAGKYTGLIKSNANFWTNFSSPDKFDKIDINEAQKYLSEYGKQFDESEREQIGFICAFDSAFPIINPKVPNGEKPFLLFYKGDITLLNDLNKNIAVIGLTDPSNEIEKRENQVLQKLVDKNINIVSGLAKGCDSIAHKYCVQNNFKTIAILPSPIHKISPAIHRELAQQIIEKQGLLLSEYFADPKSQHEVLTRYVQRDRLQAMFSKTVIMIASYRKGEGDSGSRHAMEYADKYNITRYVIYNPETDSNDKQFALNKDFISTQGSNVKALHPHSIEEIKKHTNHNLLPKQKEEQLSLL